MQNIVFNDMIADMHNNKKLNRIVTELFIRQRKLNTSLAFIMESYFAVPNNIILNLANHFIAKSNNFKKLQIIIHEILTLNT